MALERLYFAYLTEERKIGCSYKNSPQHLTLVPPFIAEPEDAIQVASTIAQNFEPFKMIIDGQTLLGPDFNIPAVLVKPNAVLGDLHESLMDGVIERGINIVDSSFTKENYLPHIAIKSHYPAPVSGQELLVYKITLMLKTKLARVALAEFNLGISNEKPARQ